jgi:hypothetical protein
MTPPPPRSQFFQPLWRRVAVVLLVALWFCFEVLYSREPLWMTIAGGMLAYAIWAFLLNWPKGEGSPPPK